MERCVRGMAGRPPAQGLPVVGRRGHLDRGSRQEGQALRLRNRDATKLTTGDKCFDEYKTGPDRDQANGDTYCGQDSPYGPEAQVGQWKFRLKVVDTEQGDVVRATGPELTIDW